MKARLSLPLSFALLLVSAVATPEDAEPPVDAGASDGAPADGGSASLEMLPLLTGVPETPSKPPKPAEWAAAEDIVASHFTSCAVRRVREWLRVRCQLRSTASIEVVAGSGKDVYFSILSGKGSCYPDEEQGEICEDQDEVVFPMRRGDRRFLQFSRRALGYGMGMSTTGDVLVSEYWLEDEPGPVVTIDNQFF